MDIGGKDCSWRLKCTRSEAICKINRIVKSHWPEMVMKSDLEDDGDVWWWFYKDAASKQLIDKEGVEEEYQKLILTVLLIDQNIDVVTDHHGSQDHILEEIKMALEYGLPEC